MNNDGHIAITGEEQVRMASTLALRGALRMEIKGMRRSGRSAKVIAQELLGIGGRPSKQKVYEELNKYIVERLGEKFDRPLS